MSANSLRASSRILFCCSAVTALIIASCDAIPQSDGPAAKCLESGVQCVLPEGPLGVCERSPCPASETSPCFQCIPQH
jgi:hypothetical protein